jgi:molybdopterin synthase sulfur carrier subunit
MLITLQLFGRFREFSDAPEIVLDFPGVQTVADFRSAFDLWAQANWAGYASGILKVAAIATETGLLHAGSPLPADGRIAVLPPVSGG